MLQHITPKIGPLKESCNKNYDSTFDMQLKGHKNYKHYIIVTISVKYIPLLRFY